MIISFQKPLDFVEAQLMPEQQLGFELSPEFKAHLQWLEALIDLDAGYANLLSGLNPRQSKAFKAEWHQIGNNLSAMTELVKRLSAHKQRYGWNQALTRLLDQKLANRHTVSQQQGDLLQRIDWASASPYAVEQAEDLITRHAGIFTPMQMAIDWAKSALKKQYNQHKKNAGVIYLDEALDAYLNETQAQLNTAREQLAHAMLLRLETAVHNRDLSNGDYLYLLSTRLLNEERAAISLKGRPYTEPQKTLTPQIITCYHTTISQYGNRETKERLNKLPLLGCTILQMANELLAHRNKILLTAEDQQNSSAPTLETVPQLSENIFCMAEQLSKQRSNLTQTAQNDIDYVLEIKKIRQELEIAKREVNIAKQESIEATSAQTDSQQKLHEQFKIYNAHLTKVQSLLETLRQPFEQTINEKRTLLEERRCERAACYESYQTLLLQLKNLEHEISISQQSELTKEPQHKPLMINHDDRLVLETKCIQLKKEINEQDQGIQQLESWLDINDIQFQSYSIAGDSTRLDHPIGQCEKLQKIQQSDTFFKRFLHPTFPKTTILEFNSAQIDLLKTDLQAARLAMLNANAFKIVHQSRVESNQEKKQLIEIAKQREQQLATNLDRVNNAFKRRLCERELLQDNLIPNRNIFTEHLDQFELAIDKLTHMPDLDRIPEKMRKRISQIDDQYRQYRCDYLQDLAEISKPYQYGWHTKENHYDQVAAARERLVVKLTRLVNPTSYENTVLRTNPKIMTKLERAWRVAKMLAKLAVCCTLVAAPFIIFYEYKNREQAKRAQYAKDSFSEAHKNSLPLNEKRILHSMG